MAQNRHEGSYTRIKEKTEKPRVADAYHLYINSMLKKEHEFLINCNTSMDSMLVFAGLFSAIISALIVETRKSLIADPQDRVSQLLEALYNHSKSLESETALEAFKPDHSAIVINLMFFIGLFCSLLAGLGGLLVKQWARQSVSGPETPKPTREEARVHYKNWAGLSRWRMDLIIAAIPMLLHVALLLFFVGILWWLFDANSLIFGVMLILISAAILLYIWLGVVSARHPNAPFKWPFSSLLISILSSTSRRESKIDLESNFRDNVSSSPRSSTQQLTLPSIDKFSLQPMDEVDVNIFCRVLDYAVNKDEISTALCHLYQMAVAGSIQTHALSPHLAQISLKRCDELASRCYDVAEGSATRETLRSDSVWEARLCCTYLQWVLNTHQFYRESNLGPPTSALRLVHSFRDNAVLVEDLDDLQLAIDSMLELQKAFYLGGPDCKLEDILNCGGLKLLIQMVPVFNEPSWQDIDEFQARVTRYIWPIVDFTMLYATNQISKPGSTSAPRQALGAGKAPVVSDSFWDTFPDSTPRSAILACKEIRELLSRTDNTRYGDNYHDLLTRLTNLWVVQGPYGWALVWLRGILGPLFKGAETIGGVRQITALTGDAAITNVINDCFFFDE